MKNVTIKFLDGDTITTRMNGSEKEIVNYFNDGNFLSEDKSKQVISLEIITTGKETGFPGCGKFTKILEFTYNKKAGCYKDLKFKNVDSNKYQLLSNVCTNWCNKHCNNGTASLKGLRQCYDWKDAYIVLCNNVYMVISYETFITV